MNRTEYITHLTEWLSNNGYDTNQCHVSHGGTMLLLGLRTETSDIDLTVSQPIWDDLIAKGYPVKIIPATETYPEVRIIEATENIDVHLVDSELDLLGKLALVDGIWYRDAQATLEDKLKLNREKDQADIAALRQVLTNQGTLPYWLA
jgi:hypothetical protein